ncbi:hypothetical protein C0991_005928 [Blastosporella zonata]|nr:hypothetical protein C0991_005928 [Blastosporella zonata]
MGEYRCHTWCAGCPLHPSCEEGWGKRYRLTHDYSILHLLTPQTVDKLEQMLGSYGPHPQGEAYKKNFEPEESPSGLLVRTGSYNVRSRVVDDDGEVYADWEWSFKLAKEW